MDRPQTIAGLSVIADYAYAPNPDEPGSTQTFWVLANGANVAASARIGANVVIGVGALIGDYSIIGAGSTIGRFAHVSYGVTLHEGVNVGEDCTIGHSCTLHAGVTLEEGCFVGPINVIPAGALLTSDTIVQGETVKDGATARAALDYLALQRQPYPMVFDPDSTDLHFTGDN